MKASKYITNPSRSSQYTRKFCPVLGLNNLNNIIKPLIKLRCALNFNSITYKNVVTSCFS